MREFRISSGTMTIRNTRSIKTYLTEINTIPLLTADEETELCFLVSQGDEKAKEKIVKHNLRFVVSVAKQFERNGVKLEDLINEGNIGLIDATETFDSSRGFKFITFAIWSIRRRMIDYIEKNGKLIRLPTNKIASNTKIRKGISFLEQKLERKPSYEEIVEEFQKDYSIGDINFFVNEDRTFTKSLDDKLGDDSNSGRLIDVIDNKDSVNPSLFLDSTDSDFRKELLLSELSRKEVIVLELYFGLNGDDSKSAIEIADMFDLSPTMIYQIKRKALKKLKKKLISQANWMIS